jgi:hypothetical protein
MPAELRDRLRALDRRRFEVAGDTVVCWFGDKGASRRHEVRLVDEGQQVRLEATIATKAHVDRMAEEASVYRWAWRRNRGNAIVGFRIDVRGRLIAEAVAPNIGLTDAEFLTYLMAVASEADRMELVLTGRDVQ